MLLYGCHLLIVVLGQMLFGFPPVVPICAPYKLMISCIWSQKAA